MASAYDYRRLLLLPRHTIIYTNISISRFVCKQHIISCVHVTFLIGTSKSPHIPTYICVPYALCTDLGRVDDYATRIYCTHIPSVTDTNNLLKDFLISWQFLKGKKIVCISIGYRTSGSAAAAIQIQPALGLIYKRCVESNFSE